ncbi:MAG: hypothetical protein HQK99_02110 [Nitrospirae bacterium]|nr:hypothetical protein [Nitrospirota bacterium]
MGEDGVDALLAVFGEVSINTRTDLAAKSDIKEMATKDDIKALRQEITTKSDLETVESALELKISESKTDSIKLCCSNSF